MLNNIVNRVRLLFLDDRESYLSFYKILGFYPKDISIYKQALLHKSYNVKSAKGRMLNNERLEFLGDAILDAVVADIVYKKFEGKREGFLTNTRSKIVQRDTLNQIGTDLGLGKLIKYTNKQSSHNSYMCGNAFEALVGAIYLDQGYRACKYFMEHQILDKYLNIDKISREEVNFKSRLIEWGQKNKVKIDFIMINNESEKTNSPIFECNIFIEGILSGFGKGYSKKESHQNAANEAYTKLKRDKDFINSVYSVRDNKGTAEDDTNSTVINEDKLAEY